jgi:hypothetical protein
LTQQSGHPAQILVSRKAFASRQAFGHAALKNTLKHITESPALAKATVPDL